MRRELKMKINRRIKGNCYVLIPMVKDNKKAMVEVEDKVVAITIEGEEEDGIMAVITGHKGEMHLECMLSLRQDQTLSLRLSRSFA